MTEVSPIEIDLLLLFYTFSNQHGIVDMPTAAMWAKQKLGVTFPFSEFKLEQMHIDALMDNGVITDTRQLLKRIFNG